MTAVASTEQKDMEKTPLTEVQQDLVDAWNSGLGIQAIANARGLSSSSVSNRLALLRKRGVELRPARDTSKLPSSQAVKRDAVIKYMAENPEATDLEVIQLYGTTPNALASYRYKGLLRPAVYSPGCRPIPTAPGSIPLTQTQAKILEFWQQGLPTGEIAAKMGSSINAIQGIVIKLRKRGFDVPSRVDVALAYNAKRMQEAMAAKAPVQSTVSVNERFDLLRLTVRMVAGGKLPSCIISGPGGLGKTFTVLQSLHEMGKKEHTGYILLKGFASARGLYDVMHENQDRLIVFDDCDSVLTDSLAKNILKGALDSYDKRVVTWATKEGHESFQFTGQVIFISNMDGRNIDQAIRTRSMLVDISLNTGEKLDRIEALMHTIQPASDPKLKQEVLEWIRENALCIKELSLRTFKQALICAEEHPHGWQQLAKFTLAS